MLTKAGFSIVELIIAIALMIMIGSAITTMAVGSFATTRLGREESRASQYLQEGVEALKSIRNQSWNLLTPGTYGLTLTSGVWTLTPTPDVDSSGKYTRTVVISSVQRDSSGSIVTSGGTLDPDTKYATVSINWNFTPLRGNTVSSALYLTNWVSASNTVGGGGSTPTTCAQYCVTAGYTNGTCRQNVVQCGQNSETNIPAGNIYCLPLSPADNCCCL